MHAVTGHAADKWAGRSADIGRTRSRQIQGQTVEICQAPGNLRGHLEVMLAALPDLCLPSMSVSLSPRSLSLCPIPLPPPLHDSSPEC